QVTTRWSALVDAYWANYRALPRGDEPRDPGAPDPYFWAYDEVDEHVRAADDSVMDLVLALADAVADDAALAYLGAGPIENLIRLHSERFVDRIDQAAIES